MFPPDLMELMRALFPLRRYFCSPDYDRALDLIGERVPLRRHEFSPERPINHWEIPPSWDYGAATIRRNGRVIWDAASCPLRIIALSAPFRGTVSREELHAHLHYDHRNPDWVPWHFRQLYRPWDRTWGFCVPRSFHDRLEPGPYEVEIETFETPAPLTVVDTELPGETPHTVTLVAHLDHPHMANDDLAGVMVGLRVMQLLGERPRRLTYRLVLVQELIGSEYYLAKMRETGELENVLGGLFLEMLGSRTPLALQRSYRGDSPVDRALAEALAASGVPWTSGAFGTVVGNDESNWEAHGVSMPSLSRFPYPEYHSDRDDMDIICPERLEQSARVVFDGLARLEQERWLRKSFSGVPCLSHPGLDLYVDPGQRAFGQHPDKAVQNLRRLMTSLPMELATARTVEELASKYDLAPDVVEDYVSRWQSRGLVE